MDDQLNGEQEEAFNKDGLEKDSEKARHASEEADADAEPEEELL